MVADHLVYTTISILEKVWSKLNWHIIHIPCVVIVLVVFIILLLRFLMFVLLSNKTNTYLVCTNFSILEKGGATPPGHLAPPGIQKTQKVCYWLLLRICMCIYIYIYTYIYLFIYFLKYIYLLHARYIYIYIYTEREREREMYIIYT